MMRDKHQHAGADSGVTLTAIMAVWAGDRPHQIKAAIESVLNQSRQADEFVIVIDGPVDSQISACLAKFKTDRSIKIVALPQNIGRGMARNHGIKLATSDIIAMMDADDVSRPNRFQKQLSYLLRHDLDIVGGGIEEFDAEPGDLSVVREVPRDATSIARMVRFRSAFNHVTLMYRRSFFLQIGGYAALNFVEDWDFYLRSLHAGAQVANIADVLVDVRRVLARRSSWPYFREEIGILGQAYSRGQLSLPILGLSLLIRLAKLLVPSLFLKAVYKFVLRRHV